MLNSVAMTALYEAGAQVAYLTTDDFRLPAIKSYLKAGFYPVLYAREEYDTMRQRWTSVLEKLGVENPGFIEELQDAE